MKEWSEIMLQRMAELKPLVLCFNGKGIYEIYRGKKCEIGIQEERLPGTDTVKKLVFLEFYLYTGSLCNAIDFRKSSYLSKQTGQAEVFS